jgi:hypothetical protein
MPSHSVNLEKLNAVLRKPLRRPAYKCWDNRNSPRARLTHGSFIALPGHQYRALTACCSVAVVIKEIPQ